MNNYNIKLPDDVQFIIHTLQLHGFEAYAVGGCVRDSILGREPGDWDITTSAMPEETKALFDKTFDTGIEHGTITVLLNHEGYEVTTYRIDGKYEDSRHPKEVTFTRNLKEDLLRRDFTINAMAYNDKDGIVDIFGGMQDLEKHMIRCVGNARERFSEDALRILRGVRFAAQLGFEIDEETKEGMKLLAPTLENISAERIQVELVKMLTSDRPELIRTAYELGITKVFLPEFDRMMETKQETLHHMYTVGEHTIHAMMNVRNDKILRLTMLLHDTGKPEYKTMDEDGVAHFKMHALGSERIAKEVLRRLKFDNDTLQCQPNVPEGVTLKKRYPATPNLIKQDPMRIKQVLSNLISNALKNTVQGYVEISYETTPSETRISVSDTGRGIPEEKLGIIFERFEKADAFIQGAGLGLPICRSIMEHMNGTIEVTSTVNKGSTFTVVFPCQVRPME